MFTSSRQPTNNMNDKPTYQELEEQNKRLSELLSKALTDMCAYKLRAESAERKVAIAKIELQNEIDRLTLTKY